MIGVYIKAVTPWAYQRRENSEETKLDKRELARIEKCLNCTERECVNCFEKRRYQKKEIKK